MTKRVLTAAAVLALSLGMTSAFAADPADGTSTSIANETAAAPSKSTSIGQDIKEGAADVGHMAKDAATDTGHFFRDAAKDTGHFFRDAAKGTGHAVKSGTEKVGHAASSAGHAVSNGAKKVGHGIAKGAKTTGHAIKNGATAVKDTFSESYSSAPASKAAGKDIPTCRRTSAGFPPNRRSTIWKRPRIS